MDRNAVLENEVMTQKAATSVPRLENAKFPTRERQEGNGAIRRDAAGA